jgi:hypothetical protein
MFTVDDLVVSIAQEGNGSGTEIVFHQFSTKDMSREGNSLLKHPKEVLFAQGIFTVNSGMAMSRPADLRSSTDYISECINTK